MPIQDRAFSSGRRRWFARSSAHMGNNSKHTMALFALTLCIRSGISKNLCWSLEPKKRPRPWCRATHVFALDPSPTSHALILVLSPVYARLRGSWWQRSSVSILLPPNAQCYESLEQLSCNNRIQQHRNRLYMPDGTSQVRCVRCE